MSNIKDDFAFFKNNENIVYLDNAATTQKPNCTIEVMDEYYKKYNTNLFRSVNKLSNHIEKAKCPYFILWYTHNVYF